MSEAVARFSAEHLRGCGGLREFLAAAEASAREASGGLSAAAAEALKEVRKRRAGREGEGEGEAPFLCVMLFMPYGAGGGGGDGVRARRKEDGKTFFVCDQSCVPCATPAERKIGDGGGGGGRHGRSGPTTTAVSTFSLSERRLL